MKLLKFKLSLLGEKVYSFYYPDFDFRKYTKAQNVLKLLVVGSLMGVFFYLALFNVVGKFSPADQDTGLLQFLIISIPVLTAVYIAVLILNGRSKLIDPPFFIPVLIFALCTTTASVLTVPASIANSVGFIGYRSQSGLVVMLIVASFYLINVYINDLKLFRRSVKIILSGLLLAGFAMLISFANLAALQTNFWPLAVLILTGSIISLTYMRKFRLTFFSIVVIFFMIALSSTPLDKTTYATLSQIIFSHIVSSVGILLTLHISNKSLLKSKLLNIFNFLRGIIRDRRIDDYKKFRDVFLISSIASTLLLVVLLIIVSAFGVVSISTLFSPLISLSDSFQQLIASKDFSKVVFGLGVDSYIQSGSFLVNILKTQGLLGFAGYLFIWIYGIRQSSLYLKYSLAHNNIYKLVAFLAYVMMFIPVLSVFIYPGLQLHLLWWTSFALLAVFSRLSKSKLESSVITISDLKIRSFRFRNISLKKAGYYINYAIALLVIVLGIYVSANFYNLVRGLT
jgi:hypothetical protein